MVGEEWTGGRALGLAPPAARGRTDAFTVRLWQFWLGCMGAVGTGNRSQVGHKAQNTRGGRKPASLCMGRQARILSALRQLHVALEIAGNAAAPPQALPSHSALCERIAGALSLAAGACCPAAAPVSVETGQQGGAQPSARGGGGGRQRRRLGRRRLSSSTPESPAAGGNRRSGWASWRRSRRLSLRWVLGRRAGAGIVRLQLGPTLACGGCAAAQLPSWGAAEPAWLLRPSTPAAQMGRTQKNKATE